MYRIYPMYCPTIPYYFIRFPNISYKLKLFPVILLFPAGSAKVSTTKGSLSNTYNLDITSTIAF